MHFTLPAYIDRNTA